MKIPLRLTVQPNDPQAVGLGERSKQEAQIAVDTSMISSPNNRNITPTQNEQSVVTPARELQHAVKCRCNQICTLDDIANTLQYARKTTNKGKYSQFKRSSFKEKQPFMVDLKDKPRERLAEATKKKNSFHNCGSTDHYANNCPKVKKKVYAIEKVPEEESSTEDYYSDSMGDAIRESSDDY
ncbi:hypothetical protein O181_086877 [Austropuccinia psidii MF-1]|uniref:Uncharacterized protein n=1 Tax=Austropuccinia psidii MF-1 TaxID=1389203 RepID=A0A9Q3P258_9BASI|nr:hypothetical protein [Austropuccinia psidii MF-1]